MTDIRSAADAVGADLVRNSMHGSRKRAQAFDVYLEGTSRRRPNGGSSGAGSGYAATWDQWGMFLDRLFMADDTLTIPRAYEDRGDFDYRTSYRFTDGDVPEDMHGDHTFRFQGVPYCQTCLKCNATVRWQ